MRLILSPLVLPFLLVYLLPANYFAVNVLLAVLFILFSLTDFFDGYLARRYKQVTSLGALLDPIADKILICSVLIALVAAQKLFFYWAILLIAREIFVMGLRNIAATRGIMLSVSTWGKAKTVSQMVFLSCVIANPYQYKAVFSYFSSYFTSQAQSSLASSYLGGSYLAWHGTQFVFLCITLGLSVHSAYCYAMLYVDLIKQKNSSHDNKNNINNNTSDMHDLS